VYILVHCTITISITITILPISITILPISITILPISITILPITILTLHSEEKASISYRLSHIEKMFGYVDLRFISHTYYDAIATTTVK
jgi:hypothetical protein